ncbi:hypothetical protein KAW18_16240 [candidate division WOR-3 bacterium]|nr:hypothetical protein [candidate division WOR-3 bacterium]MCK4528920.1 hypothetical protein [candidate division WOR-3 bacterium]
MKEKDIIVELVRIVENIGIKIIEDRLLRKGDYCRVFSNRYLIMDRQITNKDKIELLATALKKNDIENIYLTPKIREICTEKE